MSVFQVSSTQPPDETRKAKLRIVPWLLVASATVLILAAIAGWNLWKEASRKFGDVDHAADSLETRSMPVEYTGLQHVSPANRFPETVQIVFETTYHNSQHGVTLKLPGTWRSVKAEQITTPDPARRFCVLDSPNGLTAMFWPLFPDSLPSLDADASMLRTQFTAPGGFTLKGERDLNVGSRRAKELKFGKPNSDLDLNLIVIRKWPVIYALAVTGSSKSQGAWKEFEDGLPKSIEIQ